MKNKKILCLGNNTIDTDNQARQIAVDNDVIYHGLVDRVKDDIAIGLYHSSISDIPYPELEKLCFKVDTIFILDQSIDSYQINYDFALTLRLGKKFNSKTTFLNKDQEHAIENEILDNRSFCILPFIHHYEINEHYSPCCYANQQKLLGNVRTVNFNNDEKRNELKQRMIKGESIDDYCSYCTTYEKNTDSSFINTSPRMGFTVYWARKLGLNNINEIVNANLPVLFYDIRPSNVCNLQCRTCKPSDSNLIEDEDRVLKIFNDNNRDYQLGITRTNVVGFDHIIKENTFKKIVISGGEPTVMPQVYDFLTKLISLQRTDREITMSINSAVLPTKFKKIIKEFKDIRFETSVDGYMESNDYIRANSKWNKVINNIDYLVDQRFWIRINIVVSIYSIFSLDSLLEFLETRYQEKVKLQLTLLVFPKYQSVYLVPDSKLILEKLENIKKLNVYQTNLRIQEQINNLYNHYNNSVSIDLTQLEKFFLINDKYDNARNIKLIDYIPELESCRRYLTQ